MNEQQLKRAKEYCRIKNWIVLTNLLLTLGILLLILGTGLGNGLLRVASKFNNPWAQLFIYFLSFSIVFFVFQFPLSFYSGYLIEKKYELTNHSLQSWFLDALKRELLSFVLALAMIELLYWFIWRFPEHWWIDAWAAYAFVSLVLGQLFPVLIIPMFYKQNPLPESPLRAKIMNLAARFGMKIDNIYSLNLSRTTKKANAAFCGIGKTKRVILGDTLIERFDDSEIEMVLAHELGHFKHKDVLKQFIFGVIVSFVIFWISFHLLRTETPSFGTRALQDIGDFPLLSLIFYVASLILGPFGNTYSRFVERRADEFALRAMPQKNVFISSMQKLSESNLSDPNPHPLIEFLLYDHPSIQKRIQFAESLVV